VAGPVEMVLERLRGEEVLFTGEAAALFRAEIESAEPGWRVADAGAESPAAALLWLMATAPEDGRVADAAAWEPEYLRAAGAERIAAARAG
jgi:hypothetical protein